MYICVPFTYPTRLSFKVAKSTALKFRCLSLTHLNMSILLHLPEEVKSLQVISNTFICCVFLGNFSKNQDTREKQKGLENLPKAKHSWPFTFVISHLSKEFRTETTSPLSQPISRQMQDSFNLCFQTYQHWRQNRSMWPRKKTAWVLDSCQALQTHNQWSKYKHKGHHPPTLKRKLLCTLELTDL